LGQYATSIRRPLLFWFPCKQWYINVRTFNILNLLTFLELLCHQPHLPDLAQSDFCYKKFVTHTMLAKSDRTCGIDAHLNDVNVERRASIDKLPRCGVSES